MSIFDLSFFFDWFGQTYEKKCNMGKSKWLYSQKSFVNSNQWKKDTNQ